MANEVRLIDANALVARWEAAMLHMVKEADGRHAISMEVLLEDVKKASTIDPESLKAKGRLNKDGSGTCSECHRTRNDVWDMDNWDNFCSHCGADMREG